MAISELARKYLRLHLVDDVGAGRFAALLTAFGSIDLVLGARAAQIDKVKGIGADLAAAIVRGPTDAEVDEEVGLAERHGADIICLADKGYPPVLKYLPDPPPVLYIRGRYEPEDAVAIAIVGSRRCSNYGREQARRFGNSLAQAGLTIVSGLAYGIDADAHRGAVAAGGRTIAVQGCGLSMIYPPQNAELAAQIEQRGAIISEYPMRTEPLAGNFPARNRIIAGLSLGVLVVEGANNSGALITAGLAIEYNREVFAIPGRVDYPNALGVNRLIRDGQAKLVMNPEDVLDELGETGQALVGKLPTKTAAPPRDEQGPPPASLSADERRVWEAIGREPLTPDELTQLADLSIGRVLAVLTTLQLKGAIEQLPGMMFRRR